MGSDKDTSGKTPDRRDGKPRTNDKDTGAALRSVYQKTIEEQIPPEMLDLLSKLD